LLFAMYYEAERDTLSHFSCCLLRNWLWTI